MEIFTCEQLSDEWFNLRLGSIGGSSIATVCASGRGGGPSKTRTALLYRLAGEILTGVKYEGYQNGHMQRGIEQEPDGRTLYEFMTGHEVKQIGLIKMSEYLHAAPDGLIGEDGVWECKSVIPSVHIETIIKDEIPAEYRKQCQWELFVSGRKWVDFTSYSPLVIDKPILIIRRERDEKLIQTMKDEAKLFVEELLSIVKKIRGV